MNTTLWIIIGTLLLVAHAFLFIDYMKNKRSRVKQQLPFFSMFLIGPLMYFILNNNQRRARRPFMQNKRRFS